MNEDFRRGVLVGLAMVEELLSREAAKKAFIHLHTTWNLPLEIIDEDEARDIGYSIGRFRERPN